MYNPTNGAIFASSSFPTIWYRQGGENIVGGSFTTVSGQPSQQLLPSTNSGTGALGYWVGQMLATATGNGSGKYASLTAGANVNFDPASSDTGQALWNGLIIVNVGQTFPIALVDPYTGLPQVPPVNIAVATPGQNWALYQQFLYASGNPATDTTIVHTALVAYASANSTFTFSQVQSSSGAYVTTFTY